MKRLYLLMLVCLLVFASCIAGERRVWTKAFLNMKAPDLIVEKWLTNEPDRKGKFVLIDFWSGSHERSRAISRDSAELAILYHRDKLGVKLMDTLPPKK